MHIGLRRALHGRLEFHWTSSRGRAFLTYCGQVSANAVLLTLRALGLRGVAPVTAQAVQAEEKNIAKLTDSQLIVLSAAAAREDGLTFAPVKMNKAAAAKVGSRLIVRMLMREVKAKPGLPVWRRAEDRPKRSLHIVRN